MSEANAAALAGAMLRAGAGPSSDLVQQGKKNGDNAAAIAVTPDAVMPAQEPVSGDAIPTHEPPPSETAAIAAPVASASEIELKLLVDADRLASFNHAPVITSNARNKGTRRHLMSVYYDTPKRTLWRNGLTLRVRHSGTRYTQTVKAELEDDPFRRGEWEAHVPSMAADVALAMPFIPEKLRADLEAQGLEAVFTTDIRRHQRIVDLPSGTIEVAFDSGILKAGDRSMPVSEIELELKGGSIDAIYELAQRLAEHGQVRPSIRSKSARGFDLAADTPPAARKPRKLRLDPQIALDDAFAAILRACLKHLLQSLPAAEDGRDPEGIHQLRVALRRLRSALDLMRNVGCLDKLDALRTEVKWFAGSLSAAREWDIFERDTLPTVAKGCPSVAGFDALGELAAQKRLAAYEQARLVLAERRCATFIIGLAGWIEARGWRSDVAPENLGQLAEPATNFARQVLSDVYGKVIKRGRHFKSLTPEQRHRVRLAVKKLRYVGDFLLPLYGFGKPAKRFADKLASLQEELGGYNDMAVTSALLASLDAETPVGGTARAAIAGWQAHAMVGTEQRLREAWSDFTRTKVPWQPEAEAS
jgi:inorganic triphosphatase YgiF